MLRLTHHLVAVFPVFCLALSAAVEGFLAFGAAGKLFVFGGFFAAICTLAGQLAFKLATLALAPKVERLVKPGSSQHFGHGSIDVVNVNFFANSVNKKQTI